MQHTTSFLSSQGIYPGRGKAWYFGFDPACGIGTKTETVVCRGFFLPICSSLTWESVV
jgi:hypothetical protein